MNNPSSVSFEGNMQPVGMLWLCSNHSPDMCSAERVVSLGHLVVWFPFNWLGEGEDGDKKVLVNWFKDLKKQKKKKQNRSTLDAAGGEFFPVPLRTSCWHTEHTCKHNICFVLRPVIYCTSQCLPPLNKWLCYSFMIAVVRLLLDRDWRDLPGSVWKGGQARRRFDKCSAS